MDTIKNCKYLQCDVADDICFGLAYKFGIGIWFSAEQWRRFPQRASVVRVQNYLTFCIHAISNCMLTETCYIPCLGNWGAWGRGHRKSKSIWVFFDQVFEEMSVAGQMMLLVLKQVNESQISNTRDIWYFIKILNSSTLQGPGGSLWPETKFAKKFYGTGLSFLGVPGVPWYIQILADQLTLFQPGGTDFANLITTGTPGFSDLPTALILLDRIGQRINKYLVICKWWLLKH